MVSSMSMLCMWWPRISEDQSKLSVMTGVLLTVVMRLGGVGVCGR